jgi:hypothetical protein
MPESMVGGSVVYTRRRVRDRLKAILASDSVRNFVWLFYFWFIAGNIDLAFYSYPIKLVVDPMGMLVYDVWAWMPLVAAPTALLGLVLRHGGSPADEIHGRLLRRDFLGLWMQVGGHACMSVVLGVYIAAGWYGRDAHQPIPSVYWLTAYFVGVTLLAAQCIYKIRLGSR